MAKRDLNLYFLQQQALYFEMLDNLNEVNKAVQEGKCDPNVREALEKDIDIIRSNYDRLSYEMFLLNEPKDKKQKDLYLKRNKSYYDYLSGASKEAVLDETQDALKDFKKLVDEVLDNEH